MSRTWTVPGGGRAVEVEVGRVGGWFARFGDRHGGVVGTRLGETEVVCTAADGATASVKVPFPPLVATGQLPGLAIEPLLEHLAVPRKVGLILVRRGGHSLGVVEPGKVLLSRTDRHHVQGRSAAGGWSQQRFARRREGQARQALEAAAKDIVEVLLPRIGELDAVVVGGDRQAVEVLRGDRRLEAVFAIAQERVLDVAEPRRSVLEDAGERVFAVEIVVWDA
ncbi:acVLRF1 family peptidyl-tRNA hydrolase [Actinokineospora diospyrosa]|uniref:ERF1 domain-containing protein 2 n=1 Tax=Actinokineospora diospyrosa TaxID=103728 RepID=A0ABT1I739_9PSEU|nr:acVLRF1 family peptidyl-tRNA hydrolase [Actinokineospora diospyrosa]MCP2268436.1 eRF1 domain-containing protein 2 [Actinokineospora diospyrosa]